MPDVTLQNDAGMRIVVGEDGNVRVLGKAPTPDQRPSALTGPGATDPDAPAPLAKPTGRVFRGVGGDTNPLPQASAISAPTEAPLVKEDPIGNVAVGAGAAKAGSALAREVGGGILGAAVEGAHVAAVPTLTETGSPLEAGKAGALGATIGTIAHVLPAIPGAVKNRAQAIGEGAAERNTARIPTAVTGGARSADAKAVVGAGDILRETAKAHPDLEKAILTGGDAEKLDAISSKAHALTAAQDADYEQIGKGHPEAIGGRIPTAVPLSRLAELANTAHQGGNSKLKKAAQAGIEAIREFDEAGSIAPEQLRQVRNDLAETIAGSIDPASPAAQTAKANAVKVKAALNDSIETLASETPGVDVAAHKVRNRQIASLLPAQDFLKQKLKASELEPQRSLVGKAVEAAGNIDVMHPLRNITKPALAVADHAGSRVDQHLARLAGPTGPAGVAALKKVVLSPTRESIQEAVRVGIPAQVALQVARLGSQQPVTQ